jgi:hypothetical protein
MWLEANSQVGAFYDSVSAVPLRVGDRIAQSKTGLAALNCTQEWFTQSVSHFSWSPPPGGRSTFQQRYAS